MPVITADALRKRVDDIKSGIQPGKNTQGAVTSTLAVLRLVYGDNGPQIKAFLDRLKPGTGTNDRDRGGFDRRIAEEIVPVLDSALADFESGIAASIRALAKGEVLGDFIALAREALNSGADKVAAVLAAAALEETLKQLGAENGVDVYTRDFRGVVQKLKDANVLTGAQPGLANGYSTFRDRAFHGQFDQIERATTESALAFAEGLALQLA